MKQSVRERCAPKICLPGTVHRSSKLTGSQRSFGLWCRHNFEVDRRELDIDYWSSNVLKSVPAVLKSQEKLVLQMHFGEYVTGDSDLGVWSNERAHSIQIKRNNWLHTERTLLEKSMPEGQ